MLNFRVAIAAQCIAEASSKFNTLGTGAGLHVFQEHGV